MSIELEIQKQKTKARLNRWFAKNREKSALPDVFLLSSLSAMMTAGKITGTLSISWFWVLLPLLFPVVLTTFFMLILMGFALWLGVTGDEENN